MPPVTTIGNLPDYLLQDMANHLFSYSVVLYRGKQQLGSGTLIQCADRYGILTAHHVVHDKRQNPPLDLSPESIEKVVIGIMKNHHSLEVPASYFQETPIGVPISAELGPDMTFMELPKGDYLAKIKSIKSFCNLDAEPEKRMELAKRQRGVLVKMGCVNEKTQLVQESDEHAVIENAITAFVGSATSDAFFEKDDYDYVDMKVVYGGKDDPPNSYGGISGGGLWRVEVGKDKDEHWSCSHFTFCGVPFFQTPIEDGERVVRCHFAKTVYQIAREKLHHAA